MRIAIDGRTIRSGMTGVGRYAAELVARLGALQPNNRFFVFALRNEREIWQSISVAPNVEWIAVDADYEAHPSGDWWEHYVLPRLLDDLKVDVFHGPAFLIPFLARRAGCALVMTLHDLSVFSFPDAYPLKFRCYLRWVIRNSLKRADAVICVSDFVRKEALRLFPWLGANRLTVIPQAPAGEFGPVNAEEQERLRRKYELPESYLLMVGTLETRKNPGFVAKIYRDLATRLKKNEMPSFFWAGGLGFKGIGYLRELEMALPQDKFIFRKSVDAEHLRALYQCAEAFVFPSLYEGFGMPILEAMRCGLPVVASDAASLAEVVGEGGMVLSLSDPGKWGEAVAALLKDTDLWQAYSHKALKRAGEFSWEKTAGKTVGVYDIVRAE